MSNLFEVTYDLMRPGQNWPAVDEVLQKIVNAGGGGRVMQTTWIVQTSLDAATVRDRIKAVTDDGDKILVASVRPPAAWSGLSDKWSEWLKAAIEAKV